jgi:hypothetical protein
MLHKIFFHQIIFEHKIFLHQIIFDIEYDTNGLGCIPISRAINRSKSVWVNGHKYVPDQTKYAGTRAGLGLYPACLHACYSLCVRERNMKWVGILSKGKPKTTALIEFSSFFRLYPHFVYYFISFLL